MKDPHVLENLVSLQMLGKSLIKLNQNNFQFYVKFFEMDLKVTNVEYLDELNETTKTSDRLKIFSRFFKENRGHVEEVLSRNTVRERQQLKFLKFIELPMKDAYNYVLNKFHKNKQNYTADQILFCSWNSKWAEVESKWNIWSNNRIYLSIDVRPKEEIACTVQLFSTYHYHSKKSS